MLFARKKLLSKEQLAEISGWGSDRQYTPDLPHLETHQWCLFLITDDMMRGHRFNGILNSTDSRYICQAYTQNDFAMFKKNLGKLTFPILLEPKPNTPGIISRTPCYPVLGELWAIRPWLVPELDNHRLNTVEFHRRRVPIDIPYQNRIEYRDGILLTDWEHYKDQRAWLYTGDVQYWHEMTFTVGKFKEGNTTFNLGADPKIFAPVTAFQPHDEFENYTERFGTLEEAEIFCRMVKDGTYSWSETFGKFMVNRTVVKKFKPYYHYTRLENVF